MERFRSMVPSDETEDTGKLITISIFQYKARILALKHRARYVAAHKTENADQSGGFEIVGGNSTNIVYSHLSECRNVHFRKCSYTF